MLITEGWEENISVDTMPKTILSLKEVKKSYKSKEVLKGISFDIRAGDVLGFIGPNGVGKTTTIKAITGLIDISGGEIVINRDIENFKIGLVLDQNCLYSNFTAKENMELFLRMFSEMSMGVIDQYLELVGLLDVKNKRIDTFSKGMKRRLVLARTLAIDPNLLILDEPFDGLDVHSQVIMTGILKEWVRKGERCILYTSHDMAEVENLCNKVCFIKDGKIALQGTLEELLKHDFSSLRIVPRENEQAILACLNGHYVSFREKNGELWFEIKEEEADSIIDKLYDSGIRVREVNKVYHNLTDLYVRLNANE